MPQVKPFHDVVRERRSVRSFLATPVPDALIRSVAEEARQTPSNSNIQPWHVHIVSGATRNAVSRAMLSAEADDTHTPDFPWGYDELSGKYSDRQMAQAATYYQMLGVSRDAREDRRIAVLRNLEFFGAPHACLLFMPNLYGGVRVAADVGMYAQTFLLSLTAHGLSGVPQTMLGLYADPIREVLDVPSELKLLFGISFGYADPDSPAHRHRVDRAPLAETVTFHR